MKFQSHIYTPPNSLFYMPFGAFFFVWGNHLAHIYVHKYWHHCGCQTHNHDCSHAIFPTFMIKKGVSSSKTSLAIRDISPASLEGQLFWLRQNSDLKVRGREIIVSGKDFEFDTCMLTSRAPLMHSKFSKPSKECHTKHWNSTPSVVDYVFHPRLVPKLVKLLTNTLILFWRDWEG